MSAVSNSEKLRLEGNEYFKQQNFDCAISKYSEALKINPNCHLSLSNRCQCYIKLGPIFGNHAIEDGKKLAEMKPNWPKAWFRLGSAYDIASDFESSQQAYTKAYELDNTLILALERRNAAKIACDLPDEIRDAMKNGNGVNYDEIAKLVQSENFLTKHVDNKMRAAMKIRQNPQEAIEKIKKELKQTNESWMISWSTTPSFGPNGQRCYMVNIHGDNSKIIMSDMSEGEPTAEFIIGCLSSAMLNPMDFLPPRKPKVIAFTYRTHSMFSDAQKCLQNINVKAMLQPIEEAKKMAKETGNHYLGLNHLIHEKADEK